MDPFAGLADYLLGRIKQGLWAQWLRFLFEMGFSAIVSFLFSCGLVLFAQGPTCVAVGSGMIFAACAMTYLFRREASRLTKGMIVVLPADEAAKELAANFQVIQKPEQEKK